MRVLHWLHHFLPDIGGIQTLTSNLLEVLRQRHDLVLICAHGRVAAPDRSTFAGVPVVRFPVTSAVMHRDLGAVLRIRRDIQALLSDFRPDVVHLHPTGPELVLFLQIRRVVPVPSLLTIHNNFKLQNVRLTGDTGFGQALRQAEWVTAVSHDSLAWLRGEIPSLADKSSVIHNGIPPAALTPAPLPWEPPHLLYAGRLAPQKGLDILLQAFTRVLVRFPSARLTIVGEGDQRPALEAQAAALEISGAVTFTGRVEPETVPNLLNKATLFVMSSLYEGLPMVALEAAQMGRPIVATRVGGLPEAVRHGETGLLVEPQNPEALAEAITSLLGDPARAAAYGRAGRALIDQEFTIEACAAAYERLYNRLLTPTAEVPHV